MKLEVTMEDKKLLVNGLKIRIYSPEFDGIKLPDEFIPFFLDDQLKAEAIRLIRKAVEAYPETDSGEGGRKLILDAAAKGGIEAGWQMLESLLAARPDGRPRFYRGLTRRRDEEKPSAVLTDGVRAFRFSAETYVQSLPPNVYCKEENLWMTLPHELFGEAQKQAAEFFEFTKKVIQMRSIRWKRINVGEILQAFLANRPLADEMMADAELWNQFLQGALRCPQGYLTYKDRSRGWVRGYLITPTGEVFVFTRKGEQVLADDVTKAVRQNEPIQGLNRERLSDGERRSIAKAVGTVDAAMSLVLLP